MTIIQPKGQIVLFAPSYSGKSYLTRTFREMGLEAYDLETEGPYVRWCNDRDKKPVKRKPLHKTAHWLATHHFLMDRELTSKFLSDHNDCIVLVHCWDIMECLNLFTSAYFLYLSPAELEKRMRVPRADHSVPSDDQIAFMKKKHTDRLEDVKQAHIPIIDGSQTPEGIYTSIMSFQKS